MHANRAVASRAVLSQRGFPCPRADALVTAAARADTDAVAARRTLRVALDENAVGAEEGRQL